MLRIGRTLSASTVATGRTAWWYRPRGSPRGLFYSSLSVAQLPRHLLEQLPLDRAEARQPLPGDLVEHTVELLDLGVANLAAPAGPDTWTLGDYSLALRHDLVHLVTMPRPRRRTRRRTRRD